MTKQITLEEALELVSFRHWGDRGWQICEVYGAVYGAVKGPVDGNVGGDVGDGVNGNVKGNVNGRIVGNVHGNIYGDIYGNVYGTINGREGALNALDRLYEENDKGLRRLAQEDS